MDENYLIKNNFKSKKQKISKDLSLVYDGTFVNLNPLPRFIV